MIDKNIELVHVEARDDRAVHAEPQIDNSKRNREELTEYEKRKLRLTVIAMSDVMTSQDAALYLGVSYSRIRILVSERGIPYYKNPRTGRVSFRRSELDAWRGEGERVYTTQELEDRAEAYVAKRGRRR